MEIKFFVTGWIWFHGLEHAMYIPFLPLSPLYSSSMCDVSAPTKPSYDSYGQAVILHETNATWNWNLFKKWNVINFKYKFNLFMYLKHPEVVAARWHVWYICHRIKEYANRRKVLVGCCPGCVTRAGDMDNTTCREAPFMQPMWNKQTFIMIYFRLSPLAWF